MLPSVKPGHKTTEFLVTAATIVGALAAALAGSLPPKWAAIATTVAAAAYSLSRGITKTAVKATVVQSVPPPRP